MKKEQYMMGMFFLLLVNCLLVGSSLLTKEIVKGTNRPLFLTYTSVVMYIPCLLPYLPLISVNCITLCTRIWGSLLKTNSRSLEVSTDEKSPVPTNISTKYTVKSSNDKLSNCQLLSTEMEQGPNEKFRSSTGAFGQVTCGYCFVVKQSAEKISFLETVKLAGIFGTGLFIMNYLFNASMRYTSQGDSTVISTLSGPFCLIFSRVFLKEPLVLSSAFGVAMVMGGSTWIALLDAGTTGDGNSGDEINPLTGDIFAILAAFIYGIYTTLLKFYIGDDDRLSMFLYVGFTGLWTTITMWPFLFLFDYYGYENFDWPDMKTSRYLVITGLSNVLFEICWTRSVLLISPLIASVGLGLSVPLSLIADYVFYQKVYDPRYYIAAVCVVAGFTLANMKTRQELEKNSNHKNLPATEPFLKDKDAV